MHYIEDEVSRQITEKVIGSAQIRKLYQRLGRGVRGELIIRHGLVRSEVSLGADWFASEYYLTHFGRSVISIARSGPSRSAADVLYEHLTLRPYI